MLWTFRQLGVRQSAPPSSQAAKRLPTTRTSATCSPGPGSCPATAACLARLAHLEAVLGRSADAVEHGRLSLQISEKRGDHWNIVRARTALGLEALARGDAAGTVTWLAPAAEMLASGGHRLRN